MNTTNISCPKCTTTNRLPSNRLTDNPNCGKCKTKLFIGKPIELTAANVASTLRLAKLNTEDEQNLAGRWQIRSIPTLILFIDGKEKARTSGALSLTQLKQWVAQI